MICSRCLRQASSLRASISHPIRLFSSTTRYYDSPTTATPPTPPSANAVSPSSLGASLRPASKESDAADTTRSVISMTPAGTLMKGINYLKNKTDPVALNEEEYPAWLWRCLDEKKTADEDNTLDADLFAKSKKLRRKAAKRQRRLEEARIAAGDMSLFDPKVPLTQQSIDLPSNTEGTLEGAMEADDGRAELVKAMRRERRAKIKEGNYLKSV